MNSHIVEKTMHSIKNIDRLTDLAAIDVYNTTHDTINKYEIMKEHATEEYTNESFYQESVLAGVLIGAGVLGVAISAFFIIKKIIDSKDSADSSVKSSDGKMVAAQVDLSDPKSTEKYLTDLKARLEKLTETKTIKVTKRINKDEFEAAEKQINDWSEKLQEMIDNKHEAAEIEKIIEGINISSIDVSKIFVNGESDASVADFAEVLGLRSISSFASLLNSLKKKIDDVEKMVNNKKDKEAENAVQISQDHLTKLKNQNNAAAKLIATLKAQSKETLNETDKAVLGAINAETEAKKTEEPKTEEKPAGDGAAENKNDPDKSKPEVQPAADTGSGAGGNDNTGTESSTSENVMGPDGQTEKTKQASETKKAGYTGPVERLHPKDDPARKNSQPQPQGRIPEEANKKAEEQTITGIIKQLNEGKSDEEITKSLKRNNYKDDQIADFLTRAKEKAGLKDKIINILKASGVPLSIAKNIASTICDKYNGDVDAYVKGVIAENPENDRASQNTKQRTYSYAITIANGLGIDPNSITNPSKVAQSETETLPTDETTADKDDKTKSKTPETTTEKKPIDINDPAQQGPTSQPEPEKKEATATDDARRTAMIDAAKRTFGEINAEAFVNYVYNNCDGSLIKYLEEAYPTCNTPEEQREQYNKVAPIAVALGENVDDLPKPSDAESVGVNTIDINDPAYREAIKEAFSKLFDANGINSITNDIINLKGDLTQFTNDLYKDADDNVNIGVADKEGYKQTRYEAMKDLAAKVGYMGDIPKPTQTKDDNDERKTKLRKGKIVEYFRIFNMGEDKANNFIDQLYNDFDGDLSKMAEASYKSNPANAQATYNLMRSLAQTIGEDPNSIINPANVKVEPEANNNDTKEPEKQATGGPQLGANGPTNTNSSEETQSQNQPEVKQIGAQPQNQAKENENKDQNNSPIENKEGPTLTASDFENFKNPQTKMPANMQVELNDMYKSQSQAQQPEVAPTNPVQQPTSGEVKQPVQPQITPMDNTSSEIGSKYFTQQQAQSQVQPTNTPEVAPTNPVQQAQQPIIPNTPIPFGGLDLTPGQHVDANVVIPNYQLNSEIDGRIADLTDACAKLAKNVVDNKKAQENIEKYKDELEKFANEMNTKWPKFRDAVIDKLDDGMKAAFDKVGIDENQFIEAAKKNTNVGSASPAPAEPKQWEEISGNVPVVPTVNDNSSTGVNSEVPFGKVLTPEEAANTNVKKFNFRTSTGMVDSIINRWRQGESFKDMQSDLINKGYAANDVNGWIENAKNAVDQMESVYNKADTITTNPNDKNLSDQINAVQSAAAKNDGSNIPEVQSQTQNQAQVNPSNNVSDATPTLDEANESIDKLINATVQDLRSKGYDNNQIRQTLMSYGYDLDSINRAVAPVEPLPSELPLEPETHINLDAAAPANEVPAGVNQVNINAAEEKAMNTYLTTKIAQNSGGYNGSDLNNASDAVVARAKEMQANNIDPAHAGIVKNLINAIYNRASGSTLGVRRYLISGAERKKALQAAKEYLKYKMISNGVGNYWTEMDEIHAEYKRLIMECDIGIIREKKLKMIQE